MQTQLFVCGVCVHGPSNTVLLNKHCSRFMWGGFYGGQTRNVHFKTCDFLSSLSNAIEKESLS